MSLVPQPDFSLIDPRQFANAYNYIRFTSFCLSLSLILVYILPKITYAYVYYNNRGYILSFLYTCGS